MGKYFKAVIVTSFLFLFSSSMASQLNIEDSKEKKQTVVPKEKVEGDIFNFLSSSIKIKDKITSNVNVKEDEEENEDVLKEREEASNLADKIWRLDKK